MGPPGNLQASQATRVILTFDDGPIGVEQQEQNYAGSVEGWLADLDRILSTLTQWGAERGCQIQAVFYACLGRFEPGRIFDVAAAKKLPHFPVFVEGLKRICGAGHILALHALNHRTYELVPHGGAGPREDIQALLDLMEDPGVAAPFERTWRPPFGGLLTLQNEGEIAAELHLTHRAWAIDSEDWVYHQDSWGGLVNEDLWWDVVQQALAGGIFWHGGRGSQWVDILCHVNHRTSSRLPEILAFIEQEYEKTYGNGAFGLGQQFQWLTADDSAVLSDYLGPQGGS
jgi:peptidoglycan/xylan/chitin deacetylase (PgdA/CDA1 family)